MRTALAAVAVAVLTAGCLGAAAAAGPASAAEPCDGADCEVAPDPDGAAYVGSGGLLLPADSFTGSAEDRRDAATCEGCRWALVPMCRGPGQGGGVECGPAATSCPPGEFRRIVLLLRPPDTEWQEVGLVCLAGGAPTTVDDVADRLSDLVVEQAPALEPSSQPRGGTVVGLPAVFATNQPRDLGLRQFSLVGFAIELDGRATWTWDFGDGTTISSQDPGGPWPDLGVTHAYDRSGQYSVVVTASWEAWFTVDGLGPWPVEGEPLVQVAGPLPLHVAQARAELIVGP